MDTEFELFDDDKSDVNAPPSYHAVSMSSISADSVQCEPSFVFSKAQTKQIRTTVLSLIRGMVITPDFILSSVGPTLDACATSLPAAEFTDILQESNIEGHTPLYWAIVNKRPEVLSAFHKFITAYKNDSFHDVRLACMVTNDHTLFTKLSLTSARLHKMERTLNLSLGCADEIQVYEGDTENQFTAKMQITMFQTRIRVVQKLRMEFIAQGRIWGLLFHVGDDTRWEASIYLSKHSLPARPKALLTVEAQNEQHQVLKKEFKLKEGCFLAASEYTNFSIRTCTSTSASLGSWPIFNDTIYMDSNGTLHAKLDVALQ
ncbi:uncharacterized protein F5891DRAFT_632854 [Suillus fuscotomentosus]|uniref:Uncharacterized protein n=1 Tax=Suillus fuscotomentosus TaxID=1912939 RepID=A0AAD4HQ39_9AGAM|nr:uncharacterized protein F5891DRAFT_632854 [Suillus fuscotomentosus]KAG1905940.1 hypothetical protein F5891DRAFT_632854 [Suillus fuscotomentosus]